MNNLADSENKIELREHQLIMLDILKEFSSFCDKHGLKYYLDAGTLLGAVRHHGFIPWDNDLDLCLMRKDYNKLLQIAKNQNGMINDHLILEVPEDTIYCFCKIGDIRTKLIEFPDTYPEECYIYIDIFPKDGLMGLGIGTKMTCKISEILGLFHWFNKHSIPYWKTKMTGIKKVIATIASYIVKDKNKPYKLQTKWISRNAKLHPFDKCDYVTTLVNGEYYRIAPKKCFDDRVLLEFEGQQFFAPVGYDEWLKILYGNNYMTPPKKHGVHNVLAFWRSNIGDKK